MKRIFLATVIAFATLTSCTTTSDTAVVAPPISDVVVNTGNLRLFVIDTAKVNTISMTGTAETTILNRKTNSNSYIGGFSINNDASKFAYVDNQGSMVNGNYVGVSTIRTANIGGSGDTAIYTAPANTNTVNTSIGFVKWGSSKIYFTTTTQTTVGGAVGTVVKLNVTNFDGSGLVSENYNDGALTVYKADLTTNGRYLATFQSAPNIPRFVIIDRTGDNGAGTVVYQETLNATTSSGSAPVFSYDNKFAYYAFAENQTLKVKIVNMTTFATETKTIATGFSPTSFFMTMSVGSDNNRGVITVQTFGNAPSKSYVFNLSAGTSTVFNNNDANIAKVVAF